MNNLFWKGLIMVVITFLAQLIATSGLPADSLQWQVAGITLLGTIAGYVGQSLGLISTSASGEINWKDALKGALIALGNFLSGWAATWIVGTPINWKELSISAFAMFVGYLAKQVVTPTPKSA